MQLREVDDSCFDADVTFSPSLPGAESHADAFNAPGAGVTLKALTEEQDQTPARTEAFQPVAERIWWVFTKVKPAAALDSFVAWGDVRATVLMAPADDTSGHGLLWRTVCKEVL